MKKSLTILLALFIAGVTLSEAQNTKKPSSSVTKQRRTETRAGNKELKKNNYSNAVTHYRQALHADSGYAKAQYNNGIAHNGLNQSDSALHYYSRAYNNGNATDKEREQAHYNAGNVHLRKALAARNEGGYDPQSLSAAIEEYKEALRLNSKNKEAQHNLSLAKQLLRPDQQNGGGQNNQQNQDQQQNQQNQDQQNKDKQNKDQQNKDQQNKDQQNQQNQDQQNKQDKKKQEQNRREAEQMLNAMKNNEQQTMKAVRMKEAGKERRKGNSGRIEKDW